MKTTRVFPATALLGVLFLFSGFLSHGGEVRTWTDSQGRTIEAELTGVDRGEAHFKLPNGRKIPFPLKNLSDADRVYIRALHGPDPAFASRKIDGLIRERLDRAISEGSRNRKSDAAYFANLQAPATPVNPQTSEQFFRRTFPGITGRDPTPEEISAFNASPDPNKRDKLIDRLIESEDFVNHFLASFGDLLRVGSARPADVAYDDCRKEIGRKEIAKIREDRFPAPPPDRYRDWLKAQIRSDRPWNQLVKELLTASGNYSENPATGYLLADWGTGLVDPSPTLTAFAGVEVTCARCHDHPYEDIAQMDFHKLAAFFGELRFRPVEGKRFNQDVNLVDDAFNQARLPADYKYDDADAGDSVQPGVYFGARVDLDKHPTARDAFADWLTDESNPRFTINIVNRLWEHVYGTAPAEPVCNLPGHLGDAAHDIELLEYLETLFRENRYQLKEFLKILYKTETYRRIQTRGG